MEVSILSKDSIKIKGKQAVFLVDPEKIAGANAAIFLTPEAADASDDTTVVIDSPGEFEIGGVKISGMRAGSDVVYSLSVDGVDMLIGKATSLEKVQHKVTEHALLLLHADNASAAFATGLVTSVLMSYGPSGKELAGSFGKENTETMNKYSVTKDKLPQEMQTIVLA